MENINKRPLFWFLAWFITGLVICFVGVIKANALVIEGQYLGQNINTNFGINSNSYKQGVSSITVDLNNALNYYVVDLCTTLNNSFNISNVSNQSGNVSHYKTFSNLGSCSTTNYSGTLSKIYFKVNEWADAGNGNYGIIFSSRLNSTASYYGDNRILNIYTSDDVDNTSEIINNQTNELNNSINNSTNTITGSITDSQNNINQNIDNMEEAIIDSNKETQDVIKDQFNSCRDSVNLIPMSAFDSMPINKSGNTYNAETHTITYTADATDYSGRYKSLASYLVSGKTYTLSFDVRGTEGRKARVGWSSKFNTITLTETYKRYSFTLTYEGSSSAMILYSLAADNTGLLNGDYIQFDNVQVELGSTASPYEVYGEKICSNKLDDTNDKLEGIQGALTDSSTPNLSILEDSIGWLPPGPIDSILNLPLTMLNSLTNSLTKTCSPLNLTLPYVNKNIQIPCLSAIFTQITGVNSLWSWVGTIASVLILYNYLLNLYAWVDKVLTLRAEFDEAMGADLANWGRL